MLTREQFLSKKNKYNIKKVRIPGREDDSWVRGMTAGERSHWEARSIKQSMDVGGAAGTRKMEVSGADSYILAVILGLCDEQGHRILDESDFDDVAGLPAADVMFLANEISALTAVGEKAQEDIAKN